MRYLLEEVYIYKYNGSSWTELKKLSGHDSVNGDEFGQRCSYK